MICLQIDSLSSLFAETQLMHALIPHATIMFMLVGWNAMAPLLLAQTLELDSLAIGIYSAYNGVVLFVFTWFIQPHLMKRFNLKSLYIGFGCAMLGILLVFPSMTLIPGIVEWNTVLLVSWRLSARFSSARLIAAISLFPARSALATGSLCLGDCCFARQKSKCKPC